VYSLDDAPSTLELSDTRQLTWREFGDATGPPVILLHGTPGSRHQLAYVDAPDLPTARYIAIDRPGYGGSTIDLAAMLDDAATDLERLADHLGLDTFYVMGVSGGAPTAISVAALLPSRVRGVAIVSTAVPPHPDTIARERAADSGAEAAVADTDVRASIENVTEIEESPADDSTTVAPGDTDESSDDADIAPPPRRYSGRVLFGCKLQVQVSKWWPSFALRVLKRQLAPSDVALLDTPKMRSIFRADSRHPSATTAQAILLDVDQCGEVWLLPLEDVTAPVAIWHGVDDRTVPVDRARELHAALPTSTLHEISDEGHFISFSHFGEILTTLVA
jgi:pimeloyl-ACP methyl ester carboxylesterase